MEPVDDRIEESELLRRRDFLRSLMKWSSAVIGAVVLGTVEAPTDALAGWVNRRGSWVNGAGGGGWVNRGASWVNGGGSWINSGTNWNQPRWQLDQWWWWLGQSRRRCWLNSRGGGGWINRRG